MTEDIAENTLLIELETGRIDIELFPDLAPLHVEQIKTLARSGAYDNVAFHRVIEGFVAQTGDVQFGDLEDGYNASLVGIGGSTLPDLPLEPSDVSFQRGIVGMARATDPNSANSQFFIMFEEETGLDGQFTVIGQVTSGMPFVDALERGSPPDVPDRMVEVSVAIDEGIALGLSVVEAREVALLYEAGLDRDGNIDLPGLNFWINAREGGLSTRELADAFLMSTEFSENFGEPFDADDPDFLDDDAFVLALYENVLDREADEPGLNFWRSVLDQPDFDRQELLLAFASSNENVEGSPNVDVLAEVTAGEWAFLT